MTYKLVLSGAVRKQLKKLDRHIALKLAKTMEKELNNLENPRAKGKPLTANKKGYWRYRIGDYRIICEIKDAELVILAVEVGHRKYIYK